MRLLGPRRAASAPRPWLRVFALSTRPVPIERQGNCPIAAVSCSGDQSGRRALRGRTQRSCFRARQRWLPSSGGNPLRKLGVAQLEILRRIRFRITAGACPIATSGHRLGLVTARKSWLMRRPARVWRRLGVADVIAQLLRLPLAVFKPLRHYCPLSAALTSEQRSHRLSVSPMHRARAWRSRPWWSPARAGGRWPARWAWRTHPARDALRPSCSKLAEHVHGRASVSIDCFCVSKH